MHPDHYLPPFDGQTAAIAHFRATHRLYEVGVDVFELRKHDQRIDTILRFCHAAFRLESTRCLIAGLDALRRVTEDYLHLQG